MVRTLAVLTFLGLAVFFGYRIGEGSSLSRKPLSREVSSVDPDRQVPVSEFKSFAFVIHSHRQAPWCERILRTIFEQEYEHFRVIFFDDGSQDGTFEKVQAFVLENHQEDRVILIRNEVPLGPVACLYRAADTLSGEEIVIPMEAKDWLIHPKVLQRLNEAYQNQDVWMTASSPMLYPTYKMLLGSLSSQGPWTKEIFVSFYAELFQKVHLSDLTQGGVFVEGRDAYLEPIAQMAGGRCRIFQDPLFVSNQARCSREIHSKPNSLYYALKSLSPLPVGEDKTDIVLFSFDRPLQLHACLESIHRYFSEYGQIFVICRASEARYSASYRKVKELFPNVRFLFQSSKPGKDFKPLMLSAVSDSPSRFIMFGVDDQIATDFVNLKLCTEMMERTGAYGFYLRLGSHITYCYQSGKEQQVPPSIPLGSGIYAWNIQISPSDWGFPNNVDMTIYRKDDLADLLKKMRYKNPNSFEFAWAKKGILCPKMGLYFEHSKVVNIPLNIVTATGNPHMKDFPVEELLAKFERGWKIDIDPLYQIDNNSPHIEFDPKFILR